MTPVLNSPDVIFAHYGHDLAWLHANMPPHKARQQQNKQNNRWSGRGIPYATGRGGRILPQEWERRDRAASEAIRKKVKELLDAPGEPQKITLLILRQAIPALSYWPNAALLPLTKQVLDEVRESAEDFAIRRVRWATQQCLVERKILSAWELTQKSGVQQHRHNPGVQAAIQEAIKRFTLLD